MKNIIFAFAVIFLIAWLRMLILSGFSNNTIFLFLFTVAFFLYGLFYENLSKLTWLNIFIAAGFFCFVAFSIFLAAYGANDNVSYEEDALLVLGCGIRGEKVTLTLERRLDKAIEYHAKNPAAKIIVSGGQGPSEKITEASAMQSYLTARGVPAEKIIMEGQSLSTFENIYYSKKIIDAEFGDNASVALVTTEFHIFRGERFARAAGLNVTHLHSSSSWYSVPVNFARECAAVIKMFVLKK